MNGYKTGDVKPVLTKAPSASKTTSIEIGDMVWQDSAASYVPKSAADYAWNTDLATTQASFNNTFLGVALSRSRLTDTTPIRVATEGEFEFDCASASFNIGDYVGPAKQTGSLLEPQKVAAVSGVGLAIGQVVAATASTTKVRVRIQAGLLGGLQAPV